MPEHAIALPDAAVGYDRRGDGPPLLLIPGGAGDGGVFGPLSAHLADRYDVIAMYSRLASTGGAASASADQDPAAHAADALALIDELCDEPPVVFGSSSGAVTALELAVRHPDRVKTAIVHEAPLVRLLPDAERQQAMFASVRDTARSDGPAAANAVMAAGITAVYAADAPVPLRRCGDWHDHYAGTEPEPPAPSLSEVFQRLGGLQPLFLEHLLVPFATHRPGRHALEAAAARLVPAAGIDSRGQVPYRAAAALAARLGLPLTEFPGGHLGPVERPRLFADALAQLLAAEDDRRALR